MKKIDTTISRRAALAGAAAIALTPFAIRRASAQAKTLRFSSLFAEAHAMSRSGQFFADKVAEKTGGKVKVQVFHNAALGDEAQTGEGVRTGTIDMGFGGAVGYGSYIKEIRVLDLPYLYKDFDELDRVFQQIRPILDRRFSDAGVQVLGQVYDGPRLTLTTKQLNSFADFKGVKLRVPEAAAFVMLAQAFGATPTPVAFPEVYTALQAGVVQGLEGSPATLFTGKFYEVAKYLARTDHMFLAVHFGINQKTFKALDPDVQTAMFEAAKEATAFNLNLDKEGFAVDLGKLKGAGVTETKPDLTPFREAAGAAGLKFAQDLGGGALELYQKVKEVTKS